MNRANRRTAHRIGSVGLVTNIFDGRSAFLGVVNDYSLTGLQVSTIPASFEDRVERCYAIVNTAVQDFHLALQPRWNLPQPHGKFKVIGFAIEQPPAEWIRFVGIMDRGR